MIALRNLHQLNLFGRRLVVEFAKDKNLTNLKELNHEDKFKKLKNEFYSQQHFISSKFNINYPISSLLKYNYPSVTTSIICNIAKALYNCPKFYTQVLHLMNKMNLPPPFINTDYEFDEQLMPKNFNCKVVELNSESSESEIEDNQLISNTQLIRSKKRKIKSLLNEKTEKLKTVNDLQIKPNSSSMTAKLNDPVIEEYFDNYVKLKRIKIDNNLKLTNETKSEECLSIDHNFEKFTNPIKSNSQTEQNRTNFETEKSQINSETEQSQTNLPADDNCLFERQLNTDELINYSAFKNYMIGEPSRRLYIKNLDKKVTETQLRNIFIKLLNLNTEFELDAFNLSLFKKGKMNGQAFVSLSSEQMAKEAIDRTNGLLINKKPIVVCFARSTK